ncbi:viral A-type inclusion protein [Reticulomyxa filosa]|uniref:Viral A-type inclusion protein n=1 Tax=Reticulomyxa filosa TaxID=46433 RepID=X6P3C6_RETFI|nr:viral A-type inclusion protein [Reticulomyxa filosa]|eukprot:ETO32067.1 viral A-type inclusion protein [Reticulomyxa filosa]
MFKPKMKTCVKTLTSLNLAFLKQGHNFFATLQANCEYLLKYKDEVKRLKGELSEKETELQKEVEAKRASDQHSHNKRTKNEKKWKKKFEFEEKIEIFEKQLKSQKREEELHCVKTQAKANLSSLAEKTDNEELIIRGANERIVKLDDGLNEARNTGENLSKKLTALSDELEVIKKEKPICLDMLYAQNAESVASNKINNLEKELSAHKEKYTNEINFVEASNRKFSEQIDDLKKNFLTNHLKALCLQTSG